MISRIVESVDCIEINEIVHDNLPYGTVIIYLLKMKGKNVFMHVIQN